MISAWGVYGIGIGSVDNMNGCAYMVNQLTSFSMSSFLRDSKDLPRLEILREMIWLPEWEEGYGGSYCGR
jgi:hypothetical protein